MSEVTMCDGPGCSEVKSKGGSWIEFIEDSILLDFHAPQCADHWINGWVEEEVPASELETVEVTLRGQIIGSNHNLGHIYLRGCDKTAGHHPWVYRLHWATEVTPL